MQDLEDKAGGSWPSLRSFEGLPYPEASIPQMTMTPEERTAQIMVDAKNKYLFESHVPPIVWARHQQGFRIEDMSKKLYHDVDNLIMKYMPSDPLLKTIKDPEAADLYLSTLMSWYPKTQSLVALKEGSKEVIGVLIGRLVVEDNWFELLSEIQFVRKKDKYAYLKQGVSKEVTDTPKTAKGAKRKSMKRASRASKVSRRSSRRSSKRQSQVKKAGGSRKSMGAKGGSRKSMGAKGGSRKSMGAKGGGQRKSMGAKGGQRKSMGAKGGQRKSMGAKGGRKSMGGSRKSMSGSRKSMGGKSMKGGRLRAVERKKGDSKVPRPIDIIPEEVIPVIQAAVFDDDGVTFPNKELQYMQMFKKKLADRFRIWKLLKQKMYYRVYLVAVSPKYERLEIDRALFTSLRHMCFAFSIQAIAGVLTTYSAQNAFYDIGGLIVYEILYKHYPKFESSNSKSYDRSAAVMFLELPPPSNTTPEPPLVKTSLTKKPKEK